MKWLVGMGNRFPFQNVIERCRERKQYGKHVENLNLSWADNNWNSNIFNQSHGIYAAISGRHKGGYKTVKKLYEDNPKEFHKKRGITEYKTEFERTILSGDNKNYKNIINTSPKVFLKTNGIFTLYANKAQLRVNSITLQ
eukprot:TRINITY_DN895_c0_g1_i2.p3 TRINITY_DN895_c0_g1~~TRINITY_DN895_c0_g1_i2.p3  ORF type:complete len:140 (-),score=4.68 TRINITY_DN895_c0_g1_i2:1194-1613(-)